MADALSPDGTLPACDFCASTTSEESSGIIITSNDSDAAICARCVMKFAKDIVGITHEIVDNQGTRH